MCTCLLRGSLVYVVCIITIIDFQYVELFLYLKTNINAFVCLSTLRYHCYTSYGTLVCNFHSFCSNMNLYFGPRDLYLKINNIYCHFVSVNYYDLNFKLITTYYYDVYFIS